MRGLTLPFAMTKTYGSIAINLREKLKLLSLEIFFPLMHTSPSPPLIFFLLTFLFFFFFSFYPFFLNFWIHGSHDAMCPSLIRFRLCLEIIYCFSVQFILNELSLSHFLTSKIFVKTSSLESLVTYNPENRKNISTVSEFDETFLGHWIS